MILIKARKSGAAYMRAVPIFYFDVHNDDLTIDREGIDLAGPDDATARAAREARQLICETIREGGYFVADHRIEVRDETGRRIGGVRFGDAVEIR